MTEGNDRYSSAAKVTRGTLRTVDPEHGPERREPTREVLIAAFGVMEVGNLGLAAAAYNAGPGTVEKFGGGEVPHGRRGDRWRTWTR